MPLKISIPSGDGHQRSSFSSTGLVTLIIFAAGFLLIGVNYWHAMSCVQSQEVVSSDARDIHIAALERRLLASEAQNVKVALVLKSALQIIQNKYIALSTAELNSIDKETVGEANRIALGIASQPPPGIPEFAMDISMPGGDLLADDFYGMQRNTGSNGEFGSGGGFNGEGWNDKLDQFDDFFEAKDFEKEKIYEEAAVDLPSELERDAECRKMKTNYNILIGVSWGNLPYDLQEKWRAYGCDKFFSGASSV